jgi:amino acid permease
MNKSEKTGFRTALILFTCFLIIYTYNLLTTPASTNPRDLSIWSTPISKIVWSILYAILFYKIMSGKEWAKIVFSLFLLFGSILSICVMLFFHELFYQGSLITIFATLVIYVTTFLYLNFSPDFKAYFDYKRDY